PVRLTAMPTPVVLLHGFAGTARHWDRVIAELPEGRFAPLALNLADADPLTPDGVARLVSSATRSTPSYRAGAPGHCSRTTRTRSPRRSPRMSAAARLPGWPRCSAAS